VKSNSTDLFLLNNTGNKSKEMLIETFVIRDKEFNSIFSALKETSDQPTVTNTLVIGQRGAGKTTLLHRLKYAVEDDPLLSEQFIPIIFNEEQYHLSDLATLWESIGQHLEDYFRGKNIIREMDEITADEAFSQQQLYWVIESFLLDKGLCILLFFENINVFLGKLTTKERMLFKEALISKKSVRLIASSTTYSDGRIDFSSDFYDFFKIVSLNGLSKGECEKLLVKIGTLYGYEDQIRHIINNHPSRIESLRRLTGGVPRTIAYLFQIYLDNTNGKAIKDLYILIDTLTFLYKAELDQLSAQQQKVVDIIARKWDAMPVKEITRQTRLESKNVSTILAGLEKNQLVEVVKTNTKNNLYRIKERFLNIWYLMRFGRKHDKDNVVWLVRFFDAWCDETELAKRVSEHIKNLSQGEFDVEAAIDMGNTFLSCENLSQSMKMQLLEATKSVLGERMYRKLQPSGSLLSDTFTQYVQDGNYDQALGLLDEMGLSDLERYGLLSFLYFSKKDYSESAEFAKKILEIDPDNANAALTLGIIHEDYLQDIRLAKQYYEQAIKAKSTHPYAASRLGDLVYRYEDNLDGAREYHNLAIKRGFKRSYLSLGQILHLEEEFEEAELNFLNAVSANVEGAYLELAKLYADLEENKKALKYFRKSVESKEEDALINFANWYRYRARPQYLKAIELYQQAINDNQLGAYHRLGELYTDDLEEDDKAISILMEGVQKEDADSAHSLGHVFLEKSEPQQAVNYFLKSAELGRKNALFCLAEGLYSLGTNDKKGLVLRILLENADELKKYIFFELLLAKILLWNNQLDQSREKLIEWIGKASNDIIAEAEEMEDPRLKAMIRQLSNYFILMIAKGHHREAHSLFEQNDGIDMKVVLRPVYFALMENLKGDFPLEYLKAGEEYTDTIREIKIQINRIKKRVLN
jgi:tetratricopeptide (TPR) repeat protein